jgi:hypothetical protein
MAGVEPRWFLPRAMIGIAAMFVAACGDDGSPPADATSADPPQMVSSTEAESDVPVTTVAMTTPATTVPGTTVATTSPDPTTTATPPAPATAVPIDRLAGWPAPSREVVPVDQVPLLLPTAEIPADGLPVRWSHTPDPDDAGTIDDVDTGDYYAQVFADAEHDVVFTISTQIGGPDDLTPADDRRPVTIEGWDGAYATVVRPVDPDGRPGPVIRTGQRVRVVATDPSGRVMLVGTGLDDDDAIAILAGMQRVTDGPGWDVTPVMAGAVEINAGWATSSTLVGIRELNWYDDDSNIVRMITSPQLPSYIVMALGTTFDEVDINGTTGWASNGDSLSAVVWSPDETNIAVLAVDVTGLDAVEIARSVAPVDQDTYDNSTTADPPAWLDDGCNEIFC